MSVHITVHAVNSKPTSGSISQTFQLVL